MSDQCARHSCRNRGEFRPILRFLPPANFEDPNPLECDTGLSLCRRCAAGIKVGDLLEEKLKDFVKMRAKQMNKIEPDFSRTVLYYRRIGMASAELARTNGSGR